MERKEQGTVQALERGLKILELLMQEKRPMGVNEIAKCQGITPSAAYRILKTLEATGWSFQMSDDKYIPGKSCRISQRRIISTSRWPRWRIRSCRS